MGQHNDILQAAVVRYTTVISECRSETTIYSFTGQLESEPFGGLTFDRSGNLYGTTAAGGPNGGGTIFKLTPSGGSWTFQLLYSFSGSGGGPNQLGPGPTSSLTIDAAGTLYGNTYSEGAFGYGSIFKLTPSQGGWDYTSLHDFTGGSDGAYPVGQVILDANGTIYGTASAGASAGCDQGCGVVFEITP